MHHLLPLLHSRLAEPCKSSVFGLPADAFYSAQSQVLRSKRKGVYLPMSETDSESSHFEPLYLAGTKCDANSYKVNHLSSPHSALYRHFGNEPSTNE